MTRLARLAELLNPVSQETLSRTTGTMARNRQGVQHRQLAALDLLEPALGNQQQAEVAAALEFLAAPGHLVGDRR
jgi:hypothetical protein